MPVFLNPAMILVGVIAFSSVNIPMVDFLCLFLTIFFINYYKIINIIKTKKKFLVYGSYVT